LQQVQQQQQPGTPTVYSQQQLVGQRVSQQLQLPLVFSQQQQHQQHLMLPQSHQLPLLGLSQQQQVPDQLGSVQQQMLTPQHVLELNAYQQLHLGL
jgi:hypothetical protein